MIDAASVQSFRFGLFRRHVRLHQRFVDERDGIRSDTDFSAKWIVESGYQKNDEGEDGCQHAAKDEMDVDLHVLQPDQDNVQQRAENDNPPQGCRQAEVYVREPRPTQFDEATEFAYGFRLDDFFATFTGLEGKQNLGNAVIRLVPPIGTMPRRCSGQPSSIV